MQQYNSRLKINDLDAQINKLQGEIAKLQSLKNECSNNMRKVSSTVLSVFLVLSFSCSKK